MFNSKTWLVGEQKACKYLEDLGYVILDKNCKIACSELDIVCILPQKVQKNTIKKDIKQLKLLKKSTDKSEFELKMQSLKNQLKNIQKLLVVVEVKARSSKKYGEPFEAVTPNKIHNIVRGTYGYISKNHLENISVRFDVISIFDDNIEHIINAFDASE